MSFEAILAAVAVKCERLVDPMMIDQGEAGAVDKAKLLVIVSGEDRFGRAFNGLAYTKNPDTRLIESFHEFDRRIVADFEADQGIGFSKDKIRC